MEYAVFGWTAALIIFLIVEIITVNLTTIWFAGGAFVSLILNLCNAGFTSQCVAFFVVSVALIFFARPYLTKMIKKNLTRTNVDSLYGTMAKVTETINNVEEKGTAVVKGQEWTARAEDENRIIEAGEIVEIVRVSGVKLIVK